MVRAFDLRLKGRGGDYQLGISLLGNKTGNVICTRASVIKEKIMYRSRGGDALRLGG